MSSKQRTGQLPQQVVRSSPRPGALPQLNDAGFTAGAVNSVLQVLSRRLGDVERSTVTGLTAVGSTPNTNGGAPNAGGASLVSWGAGGQTLTLEPATADHPGVLTADEQEIGGDKSFTGAVSASNLAGSNSGDVTLAAVGAAPNANGATLSGQELTLQPASASQPGIVIAGAANLAAFLSHVRATTATPGSYASGDIIQYGTEEYDVLGEYAPAVTWGFTAQHAGYYRISAAIFCDSQSYSLGNFVQLTVQKNGVDAALGLRAFAPASSSWYLTSEVDTTLALAVGDKLQCVIRHDRAAGNVALFASANGNFLTVDRLL